jgi:hypothetical protein
VSARPVSVVPVMSEGRAALEKVSKEMGLGFDEADLDYYTQLFVNQLKRDPTDVECRRRVENRAGRPGPRTAPRAPAWWLHGPRVRTPERRLRAAGRLAVASAARLARRPRRGEVVAPALLPPPLPR